MVSSWSKILDYLKAASETLLSAQPSRKYLWLALVWFAGLYVVGVIGFGSFFEWGNHTLEYHDWAEISGPRFQFLRTAMRAGVFPLHIDDPSPLHGFTLRYLAIADAYISPQVVLLYWLSIQRFNLANVLILYTLGFAGLLVLRSRLRLSAISFAAVFLLFNFNGHILAHYSVGHATWGGYFLFPWFVWLILRLLDGDRSWAWTLGMSVLMIAIWLQGSFHQYVWLLILLGLVGICIPRTFWTVIRAGIFIALISAFRILPPILIMGESSGDVWNGYPSLYALWNNLVNIPSQVVTPFFPNGLGYVLGSWEMATFIGVVGTAFFLYFGIYRGLLQRDSPFQRLLLPLGILFILSLGQIYSILDILHFPLLRGERVTSRIFSVVLVFGLVLAAERLQRWLDSSPRTPLTLTGGLLGLGLIGFELSQDMDVWRISNGSQDFWKAFTTKNWSVNNNYTDTVYLWLVFGGLAISLLTFLVLAGLAWRERRRMKQNQPQTS